MSWLLFAILAIVILVGFSAFTGAPYVPSHRRDVARAFRELYPLGANDVLVDIGSGDGVVLRQASQRGARAVGYEIHPLLVLLSRWLSRGDARVTVRFANFWRVDLPNDTTAVYVFGDNRDMSRMVRYVEAQAAKIGRPLHLISYGFQANGYKAVKSVGAHHLYILNPLHK